MEWAGTNLKELFLSFFLIFANSTVFFKANQEYALDKVCVPRERGVFETQLL